MPTHKVDKEQFEKARSFVIKTLESQPRSKEGLLKAGEIISEEITNAENKDYKFSILVLVDEMNQYLEGINQSQ